MITALDDLSVLQNHDGVGVPHCGETVSDHEGGPSHASLEEPSLSSEQLPWLRWIP